MSESLLAVTELTVTLPDGTRVVEDASLELGAGEIVALLGPSGAGKTTLLRAMLQPEKLRRRGFEVRSGSHHLDADAAFVPQRGALLDHLDVAGNVRLAQHAAGATPEHEPWLEAVDLEPALYAPGRAVSTLSGGQAQRVAVARTLAAGRRILVLDEPSVGLDPRGVRQLAALLLQRAREQQIGMLLITHDLRLAALASHRIIFLDPRRRQLIEPLPSWAGPLEEQPRAQQGPLLEALDQQILQRLERARPPKVEDARTPELPALRRVPARSPGALRALGGALLHAFSPRLFRQSLRVASSAAQQALLRPLPFYLVVGVLLGFTVLYVIAKMSADVQASAVLRLVGGTYILALAPPLSAILFAATSGNAVNAWLGGLELGKQVEALEGLGVRPERYLWAPTWAALVLAYAVSCIGFCVAMGVGGWCLFQLNDAPHAVAVLSSDFLDPAPERLPYRVRALWLVCCYAIAVASIVVGRAAGEKSEAAHVTGAMTGAVIRATLFVVVMELVSIMVLFQVTGA